MAAQTISFLEKITIILWEAKITIILKEAAEELSYYNSLTFSQSLRTNYHRVKGRQEIKSVVYRMGEKPKNATYNDKLKKSINLLISFLQEKDIIDKNLLDGDNSCQED
ncbi:hypothetical protein [Parachlamydia acanthamoebae]|nr:hypothetical protein [Parachlamydia acanthamoebae]